MMMIPLAMMIHNFHIDSIDNHCCNHLHIFSHNHNISCINHFLQKRSTYKMKLMIALVSLASTSAFTMNGHNALMTRASMQKNALMMSSVDDEVAALRAAAQKAREDAQKLAKVSHRSSIVLS